MKLLICCLLCVFVISTSAFAQSATFDEVKQFFSHKVTAIDEAYPTKKRPSVDILPLWKRLGLDLKHGAKDRFTCVFGCMENDKQCFLPNPELTYFSRRNIRIIDITKEFQWDHQYLIFKDGVYIGHAEYDEQKYEEPKLVFLEDNLVSIRYLYETGSGVQGYMTDIYQINDKHGAMKVLTYRNKYERSGWEMPFDIEINSTSSYKQGKLKLNYSIKVTQTVVSGDNAETWDEPIVKDKRKIIYNWRNNGFTLDTKASNINPKILEGLDSSEVLYLTYKSKFDELKSDDKENQEWYKNFLKEIKK